MNGGRYRTRTDDPLGVNVGTCAETAVSREGGDSTNIEPSGNGRGFAVHSLSTLGDRFWSKVAGIGSDGCWNWTAGTGAGGYGIYKVRPGKTAQAHRLALIEATGGDHPGLQACHACDNPPCCNPAHLSWGTHQDNQDDKRRRKAAVLKTALSNRPEPAKLQHFRQKLSRKSRNHAGLARLVSPQRSAQSAPDLFRVTEIAVGGKLWRAI